MQAQREVKGEVKDDVRLLSLEAVADRLSISIWTTRQYVQFGIIKSVKVGYRRLVPMTEVEKIVREGLRIPGKKPVGF